MSRSKNVLLAAALGFLAGILFAPKSGKETREEISDRVNKARDAAMDGVGSFKSGVNNVKDEVKGMAESAKDSASVLADEARTRSGRVADEAKHTARSVRHDLEKNT
jgi:gas vesicle protein